MQSNSLSDLFVLSEAILRKSSAHLRHFDRVLLPRVEYIRFTGPHDLSDAGQTPECRGV
jgi:hypothetical protein